MREVGALQGYLASRLSLRRPFISKYSVPLAHRPSQCLYGDYELI